MQSNPVQNSCLLHYRFQPAGITPLAVERAPVDPGILHPAGDLPAVAREAVTSDMGLQRLVIPVQLEKVNHLRVVGRNHDLELEGSGLPFQASRTVRSQGSKDIIPRPVPALDLDVQCDSVHPDLASIHDSASAGEHDPIHEGRRQTADDEIEPEESDGHRPARRGVEVHRAGIARLVEYID